MSKSSRIREADPMAAYRKKAKTDAPRVSSPAAVFAQEQAAAATIGGKRHAGSGALTGARSDASSDRFQVECKQTGKLSLGLTVDWLIKISHEAHGCGKVPLMHLEFLAAPPDVSKRWVMMEEWMFQRLLAGSEGSDESI